MNAGKLHLHKNNQFPFFIFTFSILVVLVLPALLRDGMFMDGLIYATVSKNLAADDFKSLWQLRVSDAMKNPYYDQPPLTFWIKALFFKFLGNTLYTERIYSFTTLLINAWLMIKLWEMIYRNKPETARMSWLPVLLWVIMPVCFWSFSNNMQENTMSIFVLAAVYTGWKGYFQNRIGYIPVSGVFIFLAAMTKGIQGTFPLVWPLILEFTFRKHSWIKSAGFTATLFLVVALLFVLLFTFEESRNYFKGYFQARLINTFTNAEFTNESRFHLVKKFFESVSIPLAVCILIRLSAKKMIHGQTGSKKIIAAFLLLALCGTLPLMITKEQRRFYLVTALPYFSVSMASWVEPRVLNITSALSSDTGYFQKTRAAAIICLTGAILASALSIGRTSRDKNMIDDVHLIASAIKPETKACIENNLLSNYSLLLYFSRYHGISLFDASSCSHDYLVASGHQFDYENQNCRKMNIPLKSFSLYKCLNKRQQ
jgi:4-amino-4-deoxy-L-arabinose transferase-like glycosyltransferase